jgi:photosystem II stability/assembly factor-like uncharacterized protein
MNIVKFSSLIGFSTLLATTAIAATAPWTPVGGIPGLDLGGIAFDPKDPAKMFLGQAQAGGVIFKSANGGGAFTAIQVGGLAEAFRNIVVSPKNSNIVFAASEDDFSANPTGGVYQSTNGGTDWKRLANQPNAGTSRALVVDATGQILVVGDRKTGFFRSINAGKTWTNTIDGSSASVRAIVKDPANANTLWAVGNDYSGSGPVLWKSVNFGQSWTETTIGKIDPNNARPFAFAVIPGSEKIVVAWTGYDSATNTYPGGVVTSANAGKTWVNSTGLPVDLSIGISVTVDPVTPTTLYIGTNGEGYPNGFYKSTNSGASWTSIGNVIGGGDGFYVAAGRPAVSATTAAVFAGGADLFSSANHGASWTRQEGGMKAGDIFQVVDDELAVGGVYANNAGGVFHSTDSGKSWTRVSNWTGSTSVAAIAVDPVAASHPVYAVSHGQAWRSANAGKSWTSVRFPGTGTEVSAFIADTATGGHLYAADTGNTFFKSVNSGASWTSVKIGAASGTFTVDQTVGSQSIAIDPTTPATLYATLSSGVWKSINSGGTWKKLPLPDGATVPEAITVAKGTPSTLFASYQNGQGSFIFASTDGGKSWANVSTPNGDTVYNLIATADGKKLFDVAYDGLFMSTNGGTSWGIVDQAIQPYLVCGLQVSVTKTSVFEGDQTFCSASNFSAPLTKLTVTSPPVAAKRTAFAARAAGRLSDR